MIAVATVFVGQCMQAPLCYGGGGFVTVGPLGGSVWIIVVDTAVGTMVLRWPTIG